MRVTEALTSEASHPETENAASRSHGQKQLPLRAVLLNILVFAVILGGILVRAAQLCDGHLGYPMDDTYIHMAMAKSFALHGTWGITQYAFTSSTSSPLFTLLLTGCYWITGVHEITPLLINIVLSIAVLGWCVWDLRGVRHGESRVGWLTLLVALAIPLPILALSGMEHVLQIFLVLIFTRMVCRGVRARLLASGDVMWMAILSALLVATRYEDAFLALVAGCLFFARRRWIPGFAIGFGALLPIVVYGEIAKAHGWPFFPTSLLLKANLPPGSSWGTVRAFLFGLGDNCFRAPHIPVLFAAGAFVLWVHVRRDGWTWHREQLGLVLFLVTAVFHMCFARVGWYFRYEAYLVALGLVSLCFAVGDLGWSWMRIRWNVPMALLLCGLVLTLGFRTGRAVYLSPRGIRNIFDQQYQMGLFLQQHFPRATVVVNDIGAVSFLSDVQVLDVQGLGSLEAAEAFFHHQYSPAWLRGWAAREHAELAIVYPHIGPPPEWPRLATWTIPNNWIAGRPTVAIYGIDPAKKAAIVDALKQFGNRLPRGVVQAGL